MSLVWWRDHLAGLFQGYLFRVMVRLAGHIHTKITKLALPFASNERGATTVFLAAAIVPLVAFLGLAVDTTRGYLVKSRLNQALDAAGLAGGKVIFSATRDADIQMYFDANFPPGFMGTTVTGPTITVNANSTVLSLSAEAVLPTTFMRVVGQDTIKVASSIDVTRQATMLDVVLSIDVSSSMNESAGGGLSKIEAVRNAATTLTNILFGNDATKDYLKIGLVPWNAKVNVTRAGTTYTGSTVKTTLEAFGVASIINPLTGLQQSTVYLPNNSPVYLLSNPSSTAWKGCVYARYKNDADTTNDADIIEGTLNHPSGDWYAYEPIIVGTGEPTSSSSSNCSAVPSNQSNSVECTPCYTRGIQSLQNTKATIINAVNNLPNPSSSNPQMYTNIPEGLAWAWRVLTPAPPWTEADPNPLYPREQAIVLLTDGENTGYYGDAYKTVWGTSSGAKTAMDNRLRLLAQNIKAAGITIYIIQFGANNSATQALLKEVATSPDKPFFNYAPDNAALQDVFKEIANNLSELRLSK